MNAYTPNVKRNIRGALVADTYLPVAGSIHLHFWVGEVGTNVIVSVTEGKLERHEFESGNGYTSFTTMLMSCYRHRFMAAPGRFTAKLAQTLYDEYLPYAMNLAHDRAKVHGATAAA